MIRSIADIFAVFVAGERNAKLEQAAKAARGIARLDQRRVAVHSAAGEQILCHGAHADTRRAAQRELIIRLLICLSVPLKQVQALLMEQPLDKDYSVTLFSLILAAGAAVVVVATGVAQMAMAPPDLVDHHILVVIPVVSQLPQQLALPLNLDVLLELVITHVAFIIVVKNSLILL